MMDAAEIASLKDDAETYTMVHSARVLPLFDALEQARKERDEAWNAVRVRDVMVKKRASERDAAQEDAKDARALLDEAKEWLWPAWPTEAALRTRIEAMLEKKP